MSINFFIAKRNIFAAKNGRSFSLLSNITIAGIALGVTVLIIAFSVLDGFNSVIKEKITDFNSHIRINGFSNKDLGKSDLNLELIKSSIGPNLESIVPYIAKEAIVKKNLHSEGLSVYGIIPGSDNYGINNMIVNGNFFDSGKYEMIMGKKLAEKLRVNPGDKIMLFSLPSGSYSIFNSPPVIEEFEITGIYESGMAKYDDLIAYIKYSTAELVFNMNNRISGYNIKLNEIDSLNSIVEKLQGKLPYPHYALSLYQLHQDIFTWIELQKKPIPIVLGLIIIVAVFNIIGSLLINIIEKTESIGVLKSLGADRNIILKIFLIQGAFLAVAGIIAGNILAMGLIYLQSELNIISLPESVYFLTEVPFKTDPIIMFVVSVITFLFSLAAAYIPARIAAGISPINAIKFK